MSAIDPILWEAQNVLFRNRDAKYIILSIEAYKHLRARRDALNYFQIDGKETFMGREIAFVYTEGIVIDVGGVK